MSFNHKQKRHVVDISMNFVTEAPFSQDIGNGNSSILGGRIPWREEHWGGYSPWGHEESDTIERLNSSNRNSRQLGGGGWGGHQSFQAA